MLANALVSERGLVATYRAGGQARALAADIEALIEHVQQTVREVHGVELVHEVRIVGEALNDLDTPPVRSLCGS